MEDKLIPINYFLDIKGRFNIPYRTRKLLYYSKEQPKNVGPSLSFTLSIDIKLDDRPFTREVFKDEIEKIKKENISNDDLLKLIKEKIKVGVNCDRGNSEEPSLIYLSLPIIKPSNVSEVCIPSYYPCYAHLTPEQRWIYLDWLQDTSKPIHKGYVYLYFYGLERQLLEKNNLDAVEELLILSNYQNFIKKDAHSAIFFSYFHNGNDEILKKLAKEEIDYPINNLSLILYHSMKKSLSSKEIFEIISQYSYINKRYINQHPQLYFEELDNYFLEKFKDQKFAFYDYYTINQLPLEHKKIFLNYSLPDEIRDIEIYNILEHTNFKSDILNIHKFIHEKVKQRLKMERRKNN